MNLLFFDLETFLFEAGMSAPPMVCGTFALLRDPEWEPGDIERAREDTEEQVKLLLRDEALDLIDTLLDESDIVWVAQNAPYDFSVIMAHRPEWRERIFRLYEEGRVYDTQIYEKFLAIADGSHRRYGTRGFSLAKIVKRRLGDDISATKTDPDAWRLRYSELDGIDPSEWPEAAVHYALHDVIYLAQVLVSQRASMRDTFMHREGLRNLPKELKLQHRASWALRLASVWGTVIDQQATDALEKAFTEEMERLRAPAVEAGYIRPDGSKDTKLIRSAVETSWTSKDWAADVPRTPSGAVSMDRDALVKSGNPVLVALAEASKYEKRLSTFLPMLRKGTVHTQYNVLVDSGRTSSYSPNLQQVPRDGGMREAFRPRPGYCFVGCDYDTLEMRSLAQILWEWYGSESYIPTMVQTLREGKDLHLEFATELLGISYEEAERRKAEGDQEVLNARQFAKVGNFGFPGGLGAQTFVSYAEGYGLNVTEEEAKRLYTMFRVKWAEMPWYFRDVGKIVEASGEVTQKLFRVRADVTFTSACNTFFQGRAANGAKEALARLTKVAYTDITSPLYGSRPVLFVHDEIIMESPIRDDMSPVCEAMEQVMIEGMQSAIDAVPVTCEAVPMDRWAKRAKRVYDSQGRLSVWTPEKP